MHYIEILEKDSDLMADNALKTPSRKSGDGLWAMVGVNKLAKVVICQRFLLVK